VRLVILIGASGSGKTTIARAIEHRYPDEVEVLYFDRIGVPPVEEMIAEYGSGEAWQRAKTLDWMAKLAQFAKPGADSYLRARPDCLSSKREPQQPAISPISQS